MKLIIRKGDVNMNEVQPIRDKEIIVKRAREKQQIIHKGIHIRLCADFQQKLCRQEGTGKIYLK